MDPTPPPIALIKELCAVYNLIKQNIRIWIHSVYYSIRFQGVNATDSKIRYFKFNWWILLNNIWLTYYYYLYYLYLYFVVFLLNIWYNLNQSSNQNVNIKPPVTLSNVHVRKLLRGLGCLATVCFGFWLKIFWVDSQQSHHSTEYCDGDGMEAKISNKFCLLTLIQ